MLASIKGAMAGVVFFGATTQFDEHTLIPLGGALAVAVAVGAGIWKAGRISKEFEDTLKRHGEDIQALKATVEKLSVLRNYESDLRDAPLDETLPGGPNELPVILLVEDNRDDRLLIRHELAGKVRLIEAGTLREANIVMQREHVDCVLLDLNLPDSNRGDTVAEFLRANPAASCVALSGADDAAAVQDALVSGADSFVRKSSTAKPGYLIRQLDHAIQRRKTKGFL